jgi:Domain of unknown function (DUF222)/HNH endonuclease
VVIVNIHDMAKVFIPADKFKENRPLEERVTKILHQPASLKAIIELANIDVMELDERGRVDLLAAWEKQNGYMQAKQFEILLGVAGDTPGSAENGIWDGVDQSEREEVGIALRLAPQTAQDRIDVARALNNHLHQVKDALASGEISLAHANVIARETWRAIDEGIEEEVLRDLERSVISQAEFGTPGQISKFIRKSIAEMAPESFEKAVARDRELRKVNIYPEPNGMATLVAFLPAEDAQTIKLAIEKRIRIAKSLVENSALNSLSPQQQFELDEEIAATEKNTSFRHLLADAQKADALTSIAASFLEEREENGKAHRRPVTVSLTIDLPTLLGLANNPGELVGYGAIPASIARELAADGKWRRFITDPTSGELLDCGRETYIPSQHLVDFLMARDRSCRFPGCAQPGHRTDIDHAIPWDKGGETSRSNLGLLCRRHHQMKTHGGWRIISYENGSCEWISPRGKKFSVPVRPIGRISRVGKVA